MDKYLHALKSAESSTDIDESAILPIKQKIDHYKDKLDEFTSIKKKMTEDNLSQVTLTDPDSRMMSSHGNSDISYNLQTSVDSKNSLIIASEYTCSSCLGDSYFPCL